MHVILQGVLVLLVRTWGGGGWDSTQLLPSSLVSRPPHSFCRLRAWERGLAVVFYDD